MLSAPLLLAGNAVVAAIHFDAGAVSQEVSGLDARGHLRAVLATVTAEFRARLGPYGELIRGRCGLRRNLPRTIGLRCFQSSETEQCEQTDLNLLRGLRVSSRGIRSTLKREQSAGRRVWQDRAGRRSACRLGGGLRKCALQAQCFRISQCARTATDQCSKNAERPHEDRHLQHQRCAKAH